MYIKRFLALFILLSFVAAIVIINIRPARSMHFAHRVAHKFETMGALQIRASSYPFSHNMNLYNYVSEQVRVMYSQLERCVNGVVIYPDFYGGMVRDGTQLIMLITESMLYEAREHAAFKHLLTNENSYRFVEFSFAQLIRTREFATKAANKRPGCIYADSVTGSMWVNPQENRVDVWVVRNADTDVAYGFTRYVYDSQMLYVSHVFVFNLGGIPPHPIVLHAWVVVCLYVVVGLVIGFIKMLRWARSYGCGPLSLNSY